MSTPPEFRTWLKQRRLERGLTQDELGELVGYAGQTIRKIESGQRRPSHQLAFKLAQILQIAPEEQAVWAASARMALIGTAPEVDPSAPEGLRSLMPSLGMPTYLTPFVGREQEQAELSALLSRADCRLVTLLGPGGVGKTRLAIETARGLSGFADGVAFVSLAPVATPVAIAPAIGDAIGCIFSGTSGLVAQLISHLHDRCVLLILDNLEHLLDTDGVTISLLEQLLAHAPDVTILVTSRERLRLAGEWVVELEGLVVTQPRSAARSTSAPALTLFVEHAERVNRTFHRTPENEGTIATICRLVDGLPLGIELAASWLRLLALHEIAQELTRGIDAAHISPRTLPARHQSLRAVVEHSWQLLNAQERATLRQLSVFHGGFTREAAIEVSGSGLGVLANLADKSLLRRSVAGRYDLHEIIRQYADARLLEHAEEYTAARGRHAAHYLRLVSEREYRLKGAEQAAATVEINAEIDNIRAAWQWAAAHDMLDELARAAEVLQWFYEFRSWFQEGTAHFAQALTLLRAAETKHDAALLRRTHGRILGHYGYMLTRSGAVIEGHAALAESYTLLADGSDPVGLARTLYNQATTARWSGKYDEARRLIDASLALTVTTGDHHVRAMILTLANSAAHAVGDYDEAERLFRAALADWRVLGNPRGRVWCITSACFTLMALGKYQDAQQLLRESLTLSHATNDRYGMAMTMHRLGLLALQTGDVDEAIYFFREALPALRSSGNWDYAHVLNDLGAALWRAGAHVEARRVYGDALIAGLQVQALHETLRAMVGLAVYFVHDGQYATALSFATRVLAEPTSADESRQSAAKLQHAARAHLTPEVATRIEEHSRSQPLAVILAELTSPL